MPITLAGVLDVVMPTVAILGFCAIMYRGLKEPIDALGRQLKKGLLWLIDKLNFGGLGGGGDVISYEPR